MENPLKIPQGYQVMMPYLMLKNASKFFEFTHNVFGAKEKMKEMLPDSNGIAHGEITIEGQTIIYAEGSEKLGYQTTGLFIYVPNADETYKKAITEGATSVMEPSDQPYGRSGGVKDPFGNTWWITSVLPEKKE